MQEVPDPAVGFQRALLQVRTALEQSLATTYAEDEAEISQQDQSQCLHKRGKGRSTRRRFGSFLHTDAMDATTPNSRVSTVTNATPPQSTVEAAKSEDENTALPPEPVLPSPPTADKAKLLEHLRGLRQGMGTLPPELEQKLRDLEDKMGGAEAKLNHGHLNKMQKVQKQVTGITEKIRKLDQDWQTFVAQVEERFHKHKGLFLETRAKLVLTHRQKLEELATIKEEISRASQSLMNAQTTEELDVLDIEDNALLESLQNAAMPLEVMDEYPDMDMDGDETEVPTKSTVGPFRRGAVATSPTKVAKEHLKPKDNGKARPEAPKSWPMELGMR